MPPLPSSPTLTEIVTLDPGPGDTPFGQGIPGPEHLPDTRFATSGLLDAGDASCDQPSTSQRRVWPFGAARRIVDTAGAGLFDSLFRASFDHAIWFDRPTSGRILDGSGRRLATVAQEILARSPEG